MCFWCYKKIIPKIFFSLTKKLPIELWSSCCDYCFHWKLSSQLNFWSCPNAQNSLLYTPMVISFHQVSVAFFLKRNSKMMEIEFCSWKCFHYNWMNLITTLAYQQLVVNYLSLFCYWFKLCLRIKFKLLKKFLIDNTPSDLFGYHFHHLLLR